MQKTPGLSVSSVRNVKLIFEWWDGRDESSLT